MRHAVLDVRPRDRAPVTLRVEVAQTRAEIMRGLSGRTELADGKGMLFVLPSGPGAKPVAFWSRDVAIALDLAFVRDDGYFTTIHALAPHSSRHVRPHPGWPARWAIEVPGGWFARIGAEPWSTRVLFLRHEPEA